MSACEAGSPATRFKTPGPLTVPIIGRLYQLRPLVANIAHCFSNRKPAEILCGAAAFFDDRRRTLRRCGGVQPFPCQLRRQHQRLSVVDVDKPLVCGCSDDHEAIALIRCHAVVHLCQRRKESGPPSALVM